MQSVRAKARVASSRSRRAAGRGVRALRRHLPGRAPELSVIVPYYGVEAYLAECLDSIRDQTFDDVEVVLVDDGSLDGSRAIAERYVALDRRFRLVTRPNGGLGAARNTGVREARGRYLTFVDSDDVLPRDALRVLVESARATGSEIVVGSVERFNSRTSWFPAWVDDVHDRPRLRITAEEFPPLLRNLYTWNKLFRADFYRAQGLWFREGVAYEDQPIITQLLARARSIDVLSDIVYRYRERDDRSSISQQTASLKDLRARLAAWEVSEETFGRELSPALYDAWLGTLIDAHFIWYLSSPGTEDDDYWAGLRDAVARLAPRATPAAWAAAAPTRRVLVALALQDRRADVQEYCRQGGLTAWQWPSEVREGGVVLQLPFWGDPDLDESLFLVRAAQLRLVHTVDNLHWIEDGDGLECWISGWAYLQQVDLTDRVFTTTVSLRDEASGEIHDFPVTERPAPASEQPVDDPWNDYSPGTFGVRIPVDRLAAGREQASWTVWLRVETSGFRVEQPVNRRVRAGSAGHIPAGNLARGGGLVAVVMPYRQPMRLVVDRQAPRALEVSLDGRVLTGLLPAGSGPYEEIVLQGAQRRAVATLTHDGDGVRFRVAVPAQERQPPGEPRSWQLRAFVPGRAAAPVLPPLRADLSGQGGGPLVVEQSASGGLTVVEWALGAVADEVDSSDGREIRIRGRVHGAADGTVVVVSHNKRASALSAPAPLRAGAFEAVLPLEWQRYRFGALPLPVGNHDLTVRVSAGAAETDVPLLVSAGLNAHLPLAVAPDDPERSHDASVLRGPAGVVRLTLQRPIGDARGRYQQSLLQRTPPTGGLTRGLLLRSYFGESATDNGVSIQRELQRRGSDLPVYWAVQDRSVPVPDGGIPVIVQSREWYRLLNSASYYVDNMYQPEFHHKPDGQVLVQTFHGYPFKQMGHTHWHNLRFSQARIDSYDVRAAQWDYLVSPARYATPLLAREFNYHGQMLEIGYPRNDILLQPESEELRATVRESFGIAEGQTAVLYAPTFRDYLAVDDNRADLPDFFDFAHAHRRLGDDFVILLRGHAFNARSDVRLGRRDGVIEVTDYPEITDLYLAADVGIVDYSSLRFDFGVTGKPMIFHVPDLARYQATRGWLFDFEPTAPGPLADTTEQVVDHLLDLDGVRREYAAAYARFRADYLDLEDGQAGRRLVDAVFAPRGDA